MTKTIPKKKKYKTKASQIADERTRESNEEKHICHNKLWETFKEIEISDKFTYLLRNLYAGQEVAVRIGHGARTHSKLGKEYDKAVYCYPA